MSDIGLENAPRQEHRWVGWGWDETICEHCRVNVYVPFPVKGKYCDEYEAEKKAFEERELQPVITISEHMHNILELTNRHPLEVGFVHNYPTRKELYDKIGDIRLYCKTVLNGQYGKL